MPRHSRSRRPRLAANRGHREQIRREHEGLRGLLASAPLEDMGLFRGDDPKLVGTGTPIAQLRRRGFRPQEDRFGTLTLVDEDGVLRWEQSSVYTRMAHGRRSSRRSGARGSVVEQFVFETLETSRVGAFLKSLDRKINEDLVDDPARNLHPLTSGLRVSSRPASVVDEGRILIVVHGTFSHSKNVLGELTHLESGREFLRRAAAHYDQVLFFDHPTLQVSPVLNAVDLERLLRNSSATVDVVAHSRGGLVARWWAEVLARNPSRVGRLVLVGSPLAGTSLAAPPKLRQALDLLSNVISVLRTAGDMTAAINPLWIAVGGLLRVVSSATKVVTATPILDTAVAAVPGLVSMSRVGDNPEIGRLRTVRDEPGRYFVVSSDFEPSSVGWRFWRLFTDHPGLRVADAGADIIFRGQNDLVVDTESMADLRDGLRVPSDQQLQFGQEDHVHHLNYFRQERTIQFLNSTLQLD